MRRRRLRDLPNRRIPAPLGRGSAHRDLAQKICSILSLTGHLIRWSVFFILEIIDYEEEIKQQATQGSIY
jgi:hypothetical protein